eukprot:SM002760S10036  [mRNA]  locus=s2760:968:1519:- [translate_table: standard]
MTLRLAILLKALGAVYWSCDSFCYSLWPIWGILTMPLLFTLFMAFVVVSPYLPPYVRKPENRQD